MIQVRHVENQVKSYWFELLESKTGEDNDTKIITHKALMTAAASYRCH